VSGLLDRILEPGGLSAVFQPVVAAQAPQGPVDYFEGLVRGPRATTLEGAEVLFGYVRRKHAEALVDRACARTILSAAAELPQGARVGINVHASTLAVDLEFLSFLADTATQHGIRPDRLTVELVEHAPPWNVEAFREALQGLRAIGARVALDDIGSGLSNYRMVLDCRPDYFKLDGYFARGASRDFYRQAVLRSVVELAGPFGARVVAEGIETEGDLDAVREAGVPLVQGFLIGEARPASEMRGLDGSEDAPAPGPAPSSEGFRNPNDVWTVFLGKDETR
jgi:EAL domain-containing protein (putative c-di-GMP-specific phosphodiesterase class I)